MLMWPDILALAFPFPIGPWELPIVPGAFERFMVELFEWFMFPGCPALPIVVGLPAVPLFGLPPIVVVLGLLPVPV